ncbi:MAG: DEAD/DEAH box helicase [Cloacibacillus evryensis]
MLYQWQEKALETIAGKDAILSAPTGSGKTWVAYIWAGLMSRDGTPQMPEGRVIFTAPIKALSNERYLELKSMGFDVGLETGDFKKNAGAEVLCCTQEIYTLKYAHIPGQKVIIDEFHFIFNDPERARAYIDGLRRTSDESGILVMSATFATQVRGYRGMARRDFPLLRRKSVRLVYKQRGRAPRSATRLSSPFSKKASNGSRRRSPRPAAVDHDKRDRLREVRADPGGRRSGHDAARRGMLQRAAEETAGGDGLSRRIIDIVAGTDALSLGVNLPARGRLRPDGEIHRRAADEERIHADGRRGTGIFDTGYVSYIPQQMKT